MCLQNLEFIETVNHIRILKKIYFQLTAMYLQFECEMSSTGSYFGTLPRTGGTTVQETEAL